MKPANELTAYRGSCEDCWADVKRYFGGYATSMGEVLGTVSQAGRGSTGGYGDPQMVSNQGLKRRRMK